MPGKSQRYTFRKGDFYDTLSKRVKKFFKNNNQDKNNQSIYKANSFWIFKSIVTLLVGSFFFSITFFSKEVTYWTYLYSFLSGIQMISFAFITLHDASHWAIFSKSYCKDGDEIISRISNAIVLFNNDLW